MRVRLNIAVFFLITSVAPVLFCQCSSVRHHRPPADQVLEDPSRPSWTADDGKHLPYTRWPPESARSPGNPRTVIICVHGLSGAASDFWALGDHFPKRNSLVYAMEVRGQGNDPDRSRRGDIRSSEQWIRDLYAFTRMVKDRHPRSPIFWYGESMGALIAVHALAEMPERAPDLRPVSGLVLASPVTSIRHKVPFLKKAAVRTLMQITPGLRISLESLGSREVRDNNVTSTTTHKQQMEKTPHYVRTFTFRLFRELDQLIRTSHQAGAAITEPVLVLYTPNDVFTSKEGVEAFFDSIGTRDKTKVFYPESFHLILHDLDRDRALRTLERWIQRR